MKLRTQIKAHTRDTELIIDIVFKSKDGSSRDEARAELNSIVDDIYESLLDSYHARNMRVV